MADIETIAAAIHGTWRKLSREEGSLTQTRLDRPSAELAEADRNESRAAASRMDDVLAVAGLALSSDPAKPAVPNDTLAASLEAMAEAEHDGWMARRARNGWTWGETRDDDARRHPS